MAISLDGTLDRKDSGADAFLRGLQGNILKSHGRKLARHLFICFGRPSSATDLVKARSAARAWIGTLLEARTITDAFTQETQDKGRHTFATLLLSRAGYDFLEEKRPRDGAFRDGMQDRRSLLNDPAIENWEPAWRLDPKSLHALLIVANNDKGTLSALQASIKADLEDWGASILVSEEGEQQFNGHQAIEHFGYADGLSQPQFFSGQAPPPEQSFDQHTRLKRVLEEDRAAPGNYGSFLVFRKLEQNVRSFNSAVAGAASALHLSPGQVGAMVVGRFKNGTPIANFSTQQVPFDPKSAAADFDYANDNNGDKTPLAAHIRKTNPRGSLGGLTDLIAQEDTRRIARRGMTYGERSAGDEPTGGVGLLFMCYQADIGDQFEFIQRRWANSPSFPNLLSRVGRDPVVGQAGGEDAVELELPTAWGSKGRKGIGFSEHVRLRGGEYFFAPSMEGLKRLSGG